MSKLNEPPTGHELNKSNNPVLTESQRTRLNELGNRRRYLFNQFRSTNSAAEREDLKIQGEKVQQQLDDLCKEICNASYLPHVQRKYKDWNNFLTDNSTLYAAFNSHKETAT